MEEILLLPYADIDTPTCNDTFDQYESNLEQEGVLFFDENVFDQENNRINYQAFILTISQYEIFVKEQLKKYERIVKDYNRQLDNRFRKADSNLFPIYCYLAEEYEWNNYNYVQFTNIRLPNPDEVYNELINKIKSILLSRDDVYKLDPIELKDEVFSHAFDEIITRYEIKVVKQLRLQNKKLNQFIKHMDRKLKVIQQIECLTFFEKIKWSCQLEYQHKEKQKTMKNL